MCFEDNRGEWHWKSLTPNVKDALSSCIRIKGTDPVLYNSSLEAYPGMLIAAIVCKDMVTKEREYFGKGYRKAFFDLYSSYLSLVPTIGEARMEKQVSALAGVISPGGNSKFETSDRDLPDGIRWMEENTMDQMKIMCKKDKHVVWASVVNKLRFREDEKDFTRDAFTYLTQPAAGGMHINTGVLDEHSYTHPSQGVLNFYRNPLQYTHKVTHVIVNSKSTSGYGGGSTLVQTLSQILSNNGAQKEQNDQTYYPKTQEDGR